MSNPLDLDAMRYRAHGVLTCVRFVEPQMLARDLWLTLNALGKVATWFDDYDLRDVSPELRDIIERAREHHAKQMAAVTCEWEMP